MKWQTPKHQTMLSNGLEGAESAGNFKLGFVFGFWLGFEGSEETKKQVWRAKQAPKTQEKLQACSTLGKRRKSYPNREQI